MINVVQYEFHELTETVLSQTPGASLTTARGPLEDGGVVATLTLPRRPRDFGQELPFNGEISFVETVDVLGTQMPLLGVSAALLAKTKDALEELERAAGADW